MLKNIALGTGWWGMELGKAVTTLSPIDVCAVPFALEDDITGTLGTHLGCSTGSILRLYATHATIEAIQGSSTAHGALHDVKRVS